MNLGDCCDKAKAVITGERQDSYGSPEDSFYQISLYWSAYLSAKVHDIQLEPLDVAHMMALFKIARMQGQKPKIDNYVDAIGYLDIGGKMVADDDNVRETGVFEEHKIPRWMEQETP